MSSEVVEAQKDHGGAPVALARRAPKSRRWTALVLGSLLAIAGCTKAPFTGRSALHLVPESDLQAMSAQQYAQFLNENEVSQDKRLVGEVRGIGERIAVAAQVYYDAQGQSDRLKGFDWQFNVVESPEVNAFCMPGGKVVVFTGLLPIAGDVDSLAIVMGHEIAHALAGHGNERMSQELLAQAGGTALAVAVRKQPAQTQQAFMAAFGAGATVGVLLPFSRTHEAEADEIGLYLSTMAGYDPNAAGPLWERMASGGETPPEFLSTHPDPLERAKVLRDLVPEALEYRMKYGPEVDRIAGPLKARGEIRY
jgi:predicted Zn-dependent protease